MNGSQHDDAMASTTIFRLGGLALLLGAFLLFASMLLGFLLPGPEGRGGGPSAVPVALVEIAGLILVVWGLPALYGKQARQAGPLGLVGFLLLSTALLLNLSHAVIDAAVVPSIALPTNDPVGIVALIVLTTLLGTLGAVVFGVATIRANLLPRGPGVLLLLTSVTLLHAGPLPPEFKVGISILSGALISLALAWYGYALLSQSTVPSATSGYVAPEAIG